MDKIRIAVIGVGDRGLEHLDCLLSKFKNEVTISGILCSTPESTQEKAMDLRLHPFASFEEISKDIEEAAMIDGCSTPKMLIKIVIPLAMPGIVATAIFCIINAWNEFLYAMLLTTFQASTVPTIVQMFKTVTGVIWGEMSAVGTISTLPVLIFAILVQKHMVRGLSFGAVKD